MSQTQKYRITMEMLRMGKRRLKSRTANPCYPMLTRILNAMEPANYSAQALNKFVLDLEACYEKYDPNGAKKGRASTLYYLTKYLDRGKTKKK
mmetsp:Transcript_9066/g.17291  ORF Transcript_9066/g.17291 Transcript_9066/m.17291 type:complete len:93 (+) Transcript_9066:164-442(+)